MTHLLAGKTDPRISPDYQPVCPVCHSAHDQKVQESVMTDYGKTFLGTRVKCWYCFHEYFENFETGKEQA